ncbi:hypothetical protein [Mesotoga prima]|uniref:hypothetical protein n=1 Tax=Mesotoga prima TaxID=1184387 RepID=UPI002FDB4092
MSYNLRRTELHKGEIYFDNPPTIEDLILEYTNENFPEDLIEITELKVEEVGEVGDEEEIIQPEEVYAEPEDRIPDDFIPG